MLNNKPINYFITTILFILCSFILNAKDDKKGESGPSQSSWKHVEDQTFLQRNKNHFSNQVIKKEMLVFDFFGKAKVLKSGGKLQGDEVVWAKLSLTAKRKEYLKLRGTLLKEKKAVELIDWCEKNQLPVCAEFELRSFVRRFVNSKSAKYKKQHKRWLVYADKRQIPTSFPLPFKGTWFVSRDGSGHHRYSIKGGGAAHAFDLVIKKNGKKYNKIVKTKEDLKNLKLEDYYVFDQPILAQADGIVDHAKDGFEDNPVNNAKNAVSANVVVVYYGEGISVLYAHLKKGSVKVKKGDRVKQGQVLGHVGNSGNSLSPHLHMCFIHSDGTSIKGRFHYEAKNGDQWENIQGEDLIEGMFIRNCTNKKNRDWKSVQDSTFEDRNKNHFSNKTINSDTLVLTARSLTPKIIKKNQPLGGDQKVWATLPSSEKIKEYLEIRKKLVRKRSHITLIGWCEKNNLPLCAEYELRRIIKKIKIPKKIAYKKYHKQWLVYADKRQIDYSFPLPIKGEWYVSEDSPGLLRRDIKSAYGFDLVYKVKNKIFKGKIKNLSDLKLTDCYSYGKDVLAQGDGTVILVLDKHKDTPVGYLGDPKKTNKILIYYGGGMAAIYSYLKEGSAKVKKGDRVKQGQVIAQVGNSGLSLFPHLHFSMIDMGQVSVKGRFNYEIKNGRQWDRFEDLDLIRGSFVRNVEDKAVSSK